MCDLRDIFWILFKTPLHGATTWGYVECVRSLLNAGADVTAKNVRLKREKIQGRKSMNLVKRAKKLS